MEKRDMTILEASRALGYTKNAVKYQAGKLPEGEVYKDDAGVLRITVAGLSTLQERMGKKGQGTNQPTTSKEPPETTQQPANNQEATTKEADSNHQNAEPQPANNQQTTTPEQEENRGDAQLYEALLRTVETLEGQLRIKDVQIESLTRLLDQQQHLQAAQIQALKAPAAEEQPESIQQKEKPQANEPQRGFFGLFRKKHDSK